MNYFRNNTNGNEPQKNIVDASGSAALDGPSFKPDAGSGKLPQVIDLKNAKEAKSQFADNEAYAAGKAKSASGVRKRGMTKKKLAIISTITAIAAAMMFAAAVLWAAFPWAITVNGKEVCYFETHDDAVAVIDRIVAKNSLKYANALAMDMSSIGIVKAPVFDVEYSETKAAANLINEKYLESNKAAIKVTSIKTEKSRFTPDTEYIKDKNMLAGQSVIDQQPKEGIKKEKIRYTTENGKIVEREVLESDILKEGTPKIIRKGVVGLPDGEDWRLYDGPPVFKNGEEMVKFAKNYLGLRYVYGGNSLETGVDCVTFVINIYKKFGINLPHTFNGIKNGGIPVSMSQAKAGDVIVYNGHMALYMGNGKIIHATRGKYHNVHISKVHYTKKRHIVTIRRFVQ